jgi:CDP-glucose 4,6-dehydratase
MVKRNPRFWEGRPVFVTGATGLLGGWQITSLYEAGADVVALVRDGAPGSLFVSERWSERVKVVSGDVRDGSLLRRAFAEYSIDTVIHLAAQALVGVAKVDPVGTLEANVQGTWNVLEAARQTGVRQIIVASSDKAYGNPSYLPYDESHPLHGRYPYDVSKSCADLICAMYASAYALPVCVTRCGNLFGGGDLNYSRTVPGLIRAVLENKPFLIRSDGQFIRDFLYVKDAAAAYMHLAEQLAGNPDLAGEAFNFSLETRLTVLELVSLVLELMGREELEPVILNTATSEIREQYLSAEKARTMLGWRPKYTMREGLIETIQWHRELVEAANLVPVAGAGSV